MALGKGIEPLYPESKSGALTVILTELLIKLFELNFNLTRLTKIIIKINSSYCFSF